MNFLVLPPEINSARMYLGAGPGPMLEAATAWDGLAGELGSAASSFGSVTSGLAGAAWQGPAAVAMATRGRPVCGVAVGCGGPGAGRGGAGAGGGVGV